MVVEGVKPERRNGLFRQEIFVFVTPEGSLARNHEVAGFGQFDEDHLIADVFLSPAFSDAC